MFLMLEQELVTHSVASRTTGQLLTCGPRDLGHSVRRVSYRALSLRKAKFVLLSMYPSAEVVGLDLSPIQPVWCVAFSYVPLVLLLKLSAGSLPTSDSKSTM